MRNPLCATTAFNFDNIHTRQTVLMPLSEVERLLVEQEYAKIDEEEIEVALEDLDFEYIDLVEEVSS